MNNAIYQPRGKAREYSQWACNLYVGCSNDCSYCFNKRGVLGPVLGGTVPTLKKAFKNEEDAFETFIKLNQHRDAIIRDGGLLFSFSTDPCLPETIDLTMMCVSFATGMDVPCHILTKRSDWILGKGSYALKFPTDKLVYLETLRSLKDHVSVGFTITGHDELEQNADLNYNRIMAMKGLHAFGIKTFASIEPVITFERAAEYIRYAVPWCDLFKIGLLSGNKDAYSNYEMPQDLESFVHEVNELLTLKGKPVYWKRSVTDQLSYPLTDPCCVAQDFNILKEQ